jgi:hypothetical protein
MTNLPSICIPRISKEVDRRMIHSVFQKYHIGQIQRIDIVKSQKSNRAFIHFSSWNFESEIALQILDRLENGDKINIIYTFPWFWKCSKSRLPKPTLNKFYSTSGI